MSIKEVKSFYEKLANDEELVKQLDEIQNKATEGLEIPLSQAKKEELIKEIVIPFAKEQGFEFSMEDIKEYEQSIIDQLDDEQLESITAGDGVWHVRPLKGKTDGLGGVICKVVGFGYGFLSPNGIFNDPPISSMTICIILGFGSSKGACFIHGDSSYT